MFPLPSPAVSSGACWHADPSPSQISILMRAVSLLYGASLRTLLCRHPPFSLCHTEGGLHHSRFACAALKRGCEPNSPTAQASGPGEKGTHSIMKVRLTSEFQMIAPSEQMPEGSSHRMWPQQQPVGLMWLAQVESIPQMAEAKPGSATMRWTPVGKPWYRDKPRKGGRETSSPFPIMN